MRRFVTSAEDGHVSIYSLENGSDALLPSAAVDGMAGSFGLFIQELDDGSILAHRLPGGPAETAGLPPQMRLLAIDGIPATDALRSQAVEWTNGGIPTIEARRYFQGITLGRGDPGTSRVFTYETFDHPGAPITRTLTAAAASPFVLPGIDEFHERTEDMLEAGILEANVGYIRLSTFFSATIDSDAAADAFVEEVAEAFAGTLEELIAAGAESLILDLRGNIGGLDDLGARLFGHFTTDDGIYQTTMPFTLGEGWESDPAAFERIPFHAATPHFPGRVAILANHTTTSAAETFVDQMQALEQVRYVGLWATNGSNADVGGLALLPHGIVVMWPVEPCLEIDGTIRIDTDASGAARLKPDLRIPHTAENFAWMLDSARDIEAEWAFQALLDPLFGYFPGAETVDEDWLRHPDFGWIWTGDAPWIFHYDLGWLYLAGRGGATQQFFSPRFGWCLSRTTHPRLIYSWSDGWLYRGDQAVWSYRENGWLVLAAADPS
jgi:carboxyl-terminal processing protease